MTPRSRYISQHLGVWAMHNGAHIAEFALVRPWSAAHLLPLRPLQKARAQKRVLRAQADGLVQVADRQIRVIGLRGELTKYGSPFLSGDAVVDVRRQVRSAAADQSVDAIALLIDSPGGVVAGISDLADEVAAAAARKPVHAYIEDTGCSAAYWVASQAGRIAANRAAWIGSIGCYTVIYDVSENFQKQGIRTVLVRSANFKGAEAPGVPITDDAIGEWQKIIDEIHAQFTSAVMRGRKLSADELEALATGEVWPAAEARARGLIDAVQTWDQFLSELSKGETMPEDEKEDEQTEETEEVTEETGTEEEENSEEQEEQETASHRKAASRAGTRAATVAELRAALPGVSAEFILSCMESGLTVQQARIMAAVIPKKAAASGSRALRETGPAREADLSGDMQALAAAMAAEKGISRTEAYRILAKRDSAGYNAWTERLAERKTYASRR